MTEGPPIASAGPLAQPTAARLLEALTEAGRSLTTAEAAELAGVHANSARRHLGKLADAGLVETGVVRGDRGRPGRPGR